MSVGAFTDLILVNVDVLKGNEVQMLFTKIEMFSGLGRVGCVHIAAPIKYAHRKSGVLYRLIYAVAPLTAYWVVAFHVMVWLRVNKIS